MHCYFLLCNFILLFITFAHFFFFFFNDTATTEIYTLSLHDALPIYVGVVAGVALVQMTGWLWLDPVVAICVAANIIRERSEEHTSELQSRQYLVCRLLLEKKKKKLRGHPLIKKKKKKQ